PKQARYIVSARETMLQGQAVLEEYGLTRIDPAAEVGTLHVADKQRIEIVRALSNAGRVLVLDEPTAALAETDWLFGEIAKATAKGVAVLYISHRLAEVRAICRSATVLRNGKTISTVPLADASDDDIFEMMVGRRVGHQRTVKRAILKTALAPRLHVENLAGSMLAGVS
ncbi:sugar ABC transporter ATP-binding protein, partial [Agrobacterium sp. MCAB5]